MPALVFREVAERRLLFELALSLDKQKFRENINDAIALRFVSPMDEITFICF